MRVHICPCVKRCAVCFGGAQTLVDGVSTPCVNPSPVTVASYLNLAKIPARYALASFEHFRNRTGNCTQMLSYLREWGNKYQVAQNIHHGLIISGPVGVGKTYLLCCLAKQLAFKGVSVRFVDFFQLLMEVRASYSDRTTSSEAILAPLIQVDVLIIDELGKCRDSDFEKVILDQLVVGRYNQNKAIVASTNHPLRSVTYKEFPPLEAAVGQRIFSRLSEMCSFVELSGDDFRRR